MEDDEDHDVLILEDEYYDLFKLDDEEIISRFLKRVIVNGDPRPKCYFKEDVDDVFNKNPSMLFDSEYPVFLVVKPRTEACGKTDGCELGCWRIIGRDKLIKAKDTGKILGFKKILKFCVKRKPREYKRSWVMEEYRLTNNLNWKQDHVICKIRLLFQAEISFLLRMHFYTTSLSLLHYEGLPDLGFGSSSGQDDQDESYLMIIEDSLGYKDWPSHVTNDVYGLHPLMLVDPLDLVAQNWGICIFANETLIRGCGGGYWRILHREKLIKSEAGETLGFKKVFKFIETNNQKYACNGEEVKLTWTTEEYRLNDELRQNKRLCVIKYNTEWILE